MRFGFAPLVFVLTALGSTNVGKAMSPATSGRCHIVGGEKLPHSLSGDGICTEVGRAVAAAAPRSNYSAEIEVISKSRLAAKLRVNGHSLPAQNFAIMDSDLNEGAIQRFAAALANAIAEASRTAK